MNRRGFLKGLLSLGAVTAAGVAIVESEPVRRFWQVGRGAPVGGGAFSPYTFPFKIPHQHAVPFDPSLEAFALQDHQAHIRAHIRAMTDANAFENARAFGKTETHRQAMADHIAEHLRELQRIGSQDITFAPPVGVMHTPAGRLALAEEFMSEGLIDAAQAVQVITTGRVTT